MKFVSLFFFTKGTTYVLEILGLFSKINLFFPCYFFLTSIRSIGTVYEYEALYYGL